jgi:hypothetical protein
VAEIPLTDFGDIRDGKRQPLPAAYNTITQNEVRRTRLVGVPNATPPEMYIGDNLSEYHQAVRRITDGVSHSIQGTASHTPPTPPTPPSLEKQADDLMPLILERLRNLAPPEARAIAGEAAEHRPLDGVSLAALSDWLRDENFDGLAEEVARLKPGAGETIILQPKRECDDESLREIAAFLENLLPGKTVLLPYGVDMVGIASFQRKLECNI